ncbi:MAG: biopolymer transporter ExbD [Phaeospirillum sp.]|nr:biopolymer transporter ExbD [Phaeospirillum sp.]
MAISFGDSGRGDEDQMMASINTTPLVDIMLVLLIIFLITIPVATHTVPVNLPRETNRPTHTQPGNVTIAVDAAGQVFWNADLMPDGAALRQRLTEAAAQDPQPEVHVRGDREVAYEFVGKVVAACQRAGIVKLGFITEPPGQEG